MSPNARSQVCLPLTTDCICARSRATWRTKCKLSYCLCTSASMIHTPYGKCLVGKATQYLWYRDIWTGRSPKVVLQTSRTAMQPLSDDPSPRYLCSRYTFGPAYVLDFSSPPWVSLYSRCVDNVRCFLPSFYPTQLSWAHETEHFHQFVRRDRFLGL